jgi:hypothetical protein
MLPKTRPQPPSLNLRKYYLEGAPLESHYEPNTHMWRSDGAWGLVLESMQPYDEEFLICGALA